MNLFNSLLITHVIAGCIALISSLSALCSKKGQQRHRLWGRYFFYSMNYIFLTAIPMSLIKNDYFLFGIAIFSYYLAWSGWRYALRRELPASSIDKLISLIMLIVSIIMIAVAVKNWHSSSYQSVVFLVFGALGARFSLSDLLLFRQIKYPKYERLIRHVGGMIGGTIAVFTAVLVVNVRFQIGWVVWIAPTIIFLPLIVYWTIQVKNGRI